MILPEIMPGVVTGFLLAFTLSLDDFIISFFTTGSGSLHSFHHYLFDGKTGYQSQDQRIVDTDVYCGARTSADRKQAVLCQQQKRDRSNEYIIQNNTVDKGEMEMKKRIASFAVLLLAVAVILTACGSPGTGKGDRSEKVVLNVFNWGDYMCDTVLEAFEKEYPHIKVNYETYTTNEDMYVKIKTGGSAYDVAFPSDYMIKRMIDEGLVKEINMDNIPNYKYIDDQFKNLSFDPDNKYSVPYLWGTVGILYNKTMVTEPVDSWSILWDEKYKKQIIMSDSERDSIGITLKMLGYSMNTKNIDELEEAKQKMIEQKPLVLAYLVDEAKDMMVAESAAMAVVWSGDALIAMGENENLAYAIPQGGHQLLVRLHGDPVDKQASERGRNFHKLPV